MPTVLLRLLLLGSLGLAAGAAAAQMPEAPATCAASGELPALFASWRTPAPVQAAEGRKGLATASLTPGQAVTLALLPTPRIAYPVRPEKPGGSVSYGGLARFTVERAGSWRVALGSGAWIDVVKDGKAAPSIAHGHGPDCSGVRKMVDYSLSPGTYTLQVAANGTDSLTLLVTPLP